MNKVHCIPNRSCIRPSQTSVSPMGEIRTPAWEPDAYRWGACVNSKSWLAIISRSDGADMLRRNTGCLAMGTPVLASDTDLQAETAERQGG